MDLLDSGNVRVQGTKITSWWGSILWNSKTYSTGWHDARWRFMSNNKTVWKRTWSWLQTNVKNVLLAGIALINSEAVVRRCSVKKAVFLKVLQNSWENICVGVSHTGACNFIKKETTAQVFSCEFCKTFRNTFFQGTPPITTSETFLMGKSTSWHVTF